MTFDIMCCINWGVDPDHNPPGGMGPRGLYGPGPSPCSFTLPLGAFWPVVWSDLIESQIFGYHSKEETRAVILLQTRVLQVLSIKS